jgi:hypothetical protein
MKYFLVPLLLLLTICTVGRAQGDPEHPFDPDAEFLGSFTVTTPLHPLAAPDRAGLQAPEEESSTSYDYAAQSASGDCQVAGTVIVWRTGKGEIDLILDPSSIQFSGPCCEVDLMSTSEIFALVSRQGLAQGILQGTVPCPASCSVPTLARIYTAACVQRTGNCQTTAFASCGEELAWREYSYCCNDGLPLITELGSFGGACAAPCESTVGAGGSAIE